MKKLLFLGFAAMLLSASHLYGQKKVPKTKYNSEAEYMAANYAKDKKDLMADYLKLNEDQAKQFWPIYDVYEKKRSFLAEERFRGVQKYLAEYREMDEAKAAEWLPMAFEFRKSYAGLLEYYTRSIEAHLGARVAIQFFELESYFRADIRDRIYSEIPFINE